MKNKKLKSRIRESVRNKKHHLRLRVSTQSKQKQSDTSLIVEKELCIGLRIT